MGCLFDFQCDSRTGVGLSAFISIFRESLVFNKNLNMFKFSCGHVCKSGSSTTHGIRSELKFLEGCLIDITKLKNNKNYLVPTLVCEGFTGVTIEERQKEELGLMRKLVHDTGFGEYLNCSCPENASLIREIIFVYAEELQICNVFPLIN